MNICGTRRDGVDCGWTNSESAYSCAYYVIYDAGQGKGRTQKWCALCNVFLVRWLASLLVMRTEIVKVLTISVSAVSTIPGFDSKLSHCSDARSPAGISRRTRKLLESLLQHL